MEMLNAPSPLSLTGNVAENWRRFKQRFELYRLASGASIRGNNHQVPLLLHVMGEDALEVYNSFTWDNADDRNKYDPVIAKFDSYCTPKKNIVLERFHFNNASQGEQEEFDRFVTRLKNLAASCEFNDLKDAMIRDNIVVGIKNKAVQERLLRETDLTLEQAISIAKTSEVTKQHLQQLHEAPTVSEVVKKKTPVHKKKYVPNSSNVQNSSKKHKCRRCDYIHESMKCPAYGQQCSKCKGMNHFAKCCILKTGKKYHKTKVDAVDVEDTEEDEPDEQEFYLETVEIDTVSEIGNDWIRDISLNGTTVPMKLDTGAQANILSDMDYKKLRTKPPLNETVVKLKGVGGHEVTVNGKCTLSTQFNSKMVEATFYVVPGIKRSLLGKTLCEQLQMIKLVCVIDKGQNSYENMIKNYDVFEGLGYIPGKHIIVTDETAVPVIHPCRKVPFALQDDLKEELERMESAGVIKKVHEPTDWVNSLVIVKKKSGKLRVCLDPRDLNRAIKRQHFKLPNREEIMSRFAGATIFSKMDASQGFYQLQLDEPSSMKCTFNTPFGRYRYLHLPFGISSAPEVYSQAIRMMFEGVENVDTSMDDIIVWGKT